MTRLLTVFAALPVAGYLSLLGFAWYASLMVGHWPVYNNPDPKTLPLPWLGAAVGLLVLASIVLVPLAPALLALARLVATLRRRPLAGSLRLAWAAWVAGLSLWVFEIARTISRDRGLLEWFFD